jgi:hypothetical protein
VVDAPAPRGTTQSTTPLHSSEYRSNEGYGSGSSYSSGGSHSATSAFGETSSYGAGHLNGAASAIGETSTFGAASAIGETSTFGASAIGETSTFGAIGAASPSGYSSSHGSGDAAGVTSSYNNPGGYNPGGYNPGGYNPGAGPGDGYPPGGGYGHSGASGSPGYPTDDGFSTPTSYTSHGTTVADPAAGGWNEGGPAAAPTRRHSGPSTGTEPGFPSWVGVIALIVICIIGGLIDLISGSSVKGGFNVALVVGSIISALIVRRSSLFPVVVAPPLVYFVASAALLYERSGGLTDRSKLVDSAINWLVYGFPAIAIATAAVLVIAGVRILIRR